MSPDHHAPERPGREDNAMFLGFMPGKEEERNINSICNYLSERKHYPVYLLSAPNVQDSGSCGQDAEERTGLFEYCPESVQRRIPGTATLFRLVRRHRRFPDGRNPARDARIRRRCSSGAG